MHDLAAEQIRLGLRLTHRSRTSAVLLGITVGVLGAMASVPGAAMLPVYGIAAVPIMVLGAVTGVSVHQLLAFRSDHPAAYDAGRARIRNLTSDEIWSSDEYGERRERLH